MSTVNAGWRGPNIVKENLIQYLDAASGTSYSPYNSGTTFRDISGNNNNGSLTNGAIYSPNSGGIINLDGVNDFISLNAFSIPNNNGQLTLSFWVNFPTAPGSIATVLGDGQQDQTVGYLWIYNLASTVTYQSATAGGRINIDMSNYMVGYYNTWVNMCFVANYTLSTFIGYRNGAIVINSGLGSSPSFPSASRIRAIGSYYPSLFFANMSVGPFMMYTRTLTTQEVLQNYNATKGRFGL